jgi:hypothetical protein
MRSRRRDLPAIGHDWSARQATMFVVALLVAMLFAPVAARAAGTLVSIVDPSTGAKAHVSDGQLEVGDGNGALTINGNVKATFPNPQPIAGTVNVQNTVGAPLHVKVENMAGAPVPINGAVTVTDTLNARHALPESPWSKFVQGNGGDTVTLVPVVQNNLDVAISSFTIVNGGDTKGIAIIKSGDCSPGGTLTTDTEMSVGPNETAHFEYPEPLVATLTGGQCLEVQLSGNGTLTLTGVGFTQ